MNRGRKIFRTFIVFFILALGVFIFYKYFWVFGSGTKAGTLNTFMKKGYVFKTYEGKIIQSGFRQNIQSIEFNFSVTNERVAKTLLENAGAELMVHYVEYKSPLPWRGMERYVVDSVYEIKHRDQIQGINPR